ncbi:unnamed protein product [Fusarium graminearum]|nr:unnamed protein product [Fusarium graminearum]
MYRVKISLSQRSKSYKQDRGFPSKYPHGVMGARVNLKDSVFLKVAGLSLDFQGLMNLFVPVVCCIIRSSDHDKPGVSHSLNDSNGLWSA